MARIFDMMHAVTSLSIFFVSHGEGHIELTNKVFLYLKMYPNQGYAINPQPLTLNSEYKKVDLNMDFGKSALIFPGIYW